MNKRTLLKWRKEALKDRQRNELYQDTVFVKKEMAIDYINKVLELTQILIDQDLLKN